MDIDPEELRPPGVKLPSPEQFRDANEVYRDIAKHFGEHWRQSPFELGIGVDYDAKRFNGQSFN